jgi:uncharacterized protein YbcI
MGALSLVHANTLYRIPLRFFKNPSGPACLTAYTAGQIGGPAAGWGSGVDLRLVDDLLFTVMRGGITQSEQTMLDAGREDIVRQFRQEFENEMTPRLISMVEQLTGRRVLAYQSQVLFEPNMTVEIFVFDDQAPLEQLRETAQAAAVSPAGLISGDEVKAPGAAVDAAHAVTMIGLAVGDLGPHRLTPASATTATAFAAAGTAAGRRG